MGEQTMYRLSWESVSAIRHPQCYGRDERACVPAGQCPDEMWHATSRDTADPWDQLEGLRALRSEGELIRAIKLERLKLAETVETIEVDEP